MIKYKYPIEKSPSPILATRLTFEDSIKRVPIELATFLNDRDARIKMDENKQMLTVTSSLLSGEEIDTVVEKCLRGLNLACPKRIRTTF